MFNFEITYKTSKVCYFLTIRQFLESELNKKNVSLKMKQLQLFKKHIGNQLSENLTPTLLKIMVFLMRTLVNLFNLLPINGEKIAYFMY